MKNYRLLINISVFAFLLCVSCGKRSNMIKDHSGDVHNKESVPTINLPIYLSLKQSNFYLSDIADSISYIVLKTPLNVIVGNIIKIEFSSNNLIIVDQTLTVFVFDKVGRFVSHFNHKGRGNGEYRNISGIAIDSQNQLLAIASDDDEKVFFYNNDGTFLKEVKFDTDPVAISFLGDSLFLVKLSPYFPINESEVLSSVVINETGEIVQKHIYNVKEKSGSSIAIRFYGSIENSKYGKTIFEPFNDTIYLLTKAGIRIPFLITAFDEYKATREAYEGVQFFQKFGSQYFSQPTIHTFNDYTLISFAFNSLTYYGLFDLRSHSAILLEKNKIISGLKNDLDLGPPFIYPTIIYENNIIDILQPSKLLNDKSLKPNENSKLDLVMRDLHENENPIIRIIKTKTNIKF